jgi:hypothetical protein
VLRKVVDTIHTNPGGRHSIERLGRAEPVPARDALGRVHDLSHEVSEPDAGTVVEVPPEVLTGGNNTKHVVRVGETVRRARGHRTAEVGEGVRLRLPAGTDLAQATLSHAASATTVRQLGRAERPQRSL